MSNFELYLIFALTMLLLGLFSVMHAYKKDKRGRVDSSVAFMVAIPGFFGIVGAIVLFVPVVSEYEKEKHLEEFSSGTRVFYCPENKESQKMNKVALSDGFIYDSDKDMFINQKTGVAYSFNVDGRVCK